MSDKLQFVVEGLAPKVLVKDSSQEAELSLTPKEFANFSPGFPTLGNKAVKILSTLKELRNRMKLLGELGVQCWLIDPR